MLLKSYRLVRDAAVNAPWDQPPPQFNELELVYRYMRPLAVDEPGEVVWVLPLDNRCQLLSPGPIVVARSGADSVLVSIIQVLQPVAAYAAAGFVLVHNHPGGDPNPSEGDDTMTQLIVDAAAALGVQFEDHVILGGSSCYSYRAAGKLGGGQP